MMRGVIRVGFFFDEVWVKGGCCCFVAKLGGVVEDEAGIRTMSLSD